MRRTPHRPIEVVNADALSFSVDVLVLKHAQVSLGVDATAKERLDLDLDLRLGMGSHLIVDAKPALGAQKVVFLGVPPLQEFGYPEIRLFARRAMSLTAQELPGTKDIALTLHGAGYGLDEIACFDAELAGLMDAFEMGTFPSLLERVVVLESDVGRAKRLQHYLEEALPRNNDSPGTASLPPPGPELGGIAASARAQRDHAFVAMPFADGFADAFHYGIQPSIHASGLLCERIDQEVFTGDVLDRIKRKIRSATLLAADLTGANPNVYLEVGFAWAADVPTVLLRREGSDLKFDVQGERCLSYTSIKDLEEKLTWEIKQLTG